MEKGTYTTDSITATTTIRPGSYYYGTTEDTFQKKVERYMKCDKRTLAEMLALRDTENETPSYGITYPYTATPINVEYHTISGDLKSGQIDGSISVNTPNPNTTTYYKKDEDNVVYTAHASKGKTCCGRKTEQDDSVGQFSYGCS